MSMKIALKFIPKRLINNIAEWVQIMVRRRPGAMPLSEPMWLFYWRIYAALGLNDLETTISNTKI